MRVGIISEGHSDRAVIAMVILKATSLDVTDIKPIRPVYKLDATDIAGNDDKTISNWTHVKRECEEKEMISAFLSIEGQDFIVLHIDTAEAELYEVIRPNKPSDSYCLGLRHAVIAQIQIWLNGEYLDRILYAIAIEEIEAWLLSINTDIADSTRPNKPKEKLQHELGKKGIDSSVDEDNYKKLAKQLLKAKPKQLEAILKTNCSLKEFYVEVQAKLPA